MAEFEPLRIDGCGSRLHADCMHTICRIAVIICLAGEFFIPAADAAQPNQQPLPEATGPIIGYPSVAAALAALHARSDVVFTTENGWTIVTDEAHYTIWTFAPPSYPAYPAVVKRQVVPEGTGSSIEMSVQCEASKVACDNLVRTFSQMNGFQLPK